MIRLFRLLCCLAVLLLFESRVTTAATPMEKLKVGFFQFDGYHIRTGQVEDGDYRRSGYGYEVLQMLLPYTTWEYEYVGYEKGWSAMLPMLEKGEIDILTSAVKIPEKEKKFDFSSRPIGYSSVIMTVKAGSTRFLPHDYAHWHGMKVGVLIDNSKNKPFAEFAAAKQFRYQEVKFTQIDKMHAALQTGKIDAIVTGSLRRLRNEWLYEELDVRPFYIIVKKGNKRLMDEINLALDKLEMDYPGYATELQKKYYDRTESSNDEISLSLNELAFRNKCKSNKQRFSVLVNPDRFPFSYFEEGQFKGIMKTLLDTIETRSGLEFDPIFCKSRDEYRNLLDDRKCDLVLDMRHDFSKAEQQGYLLSPTYLSAVVSRISRKRFSGVMNSCAVVANSNMADIVRSDSDSTCKINDYPTLQAVIDAVKNGRENAGFVFTRTAEYAILNDRVGTLTLAPSGYVINYAIGTKKELDRCLINIISKAVQSLSEDEVQQALIADNLIQKHRLTLHEVIAEYPMTFFLSLTGLAFVLGSALVVVRIYHRRSIKAAAALAKNSRMWKLLINSLPIHIFAKEGDKDQQYIFNNNARAEFFGRDIEQMNHTTDYDYMPLDLADERRRMDHALCDVGQGQNEYMLNIEGADGTIHHLYSLVVPFIDSDGTRLLLGCSVDQTELEEARNRENEHAIQLRQALDQAQQASAAKGVFLSQMSHEIRTPLNAMIGYLNIAIDCDGNREKIQECLTKGLSASTHLLSIINDILDISSIENGKMKLAHEDFDFKRLLTGIVSMFYHQAQSKQIRFELILKELTEEWLVGDSLRVNQILLNLLSNGMKFTPKGGSVTLMVTQLGIVHNRVQLMLRVSDTGRGMSKDFMSRVFLPFEQQDASTAREFGGTGLGLSIVNNLVTLMGGTIDIDSKENEGTTFTINLSFEKSAKTKATADVDFSRLRALVADDQKEDRDYIKMVLNKCGLKCDLVDSGEAAIRQMERRLSSRHPYDLCLLDLRLSGIDGLEAARRIRELDNNTAFPIILVTAYDVSAISAEAHQAGVNKIIQKPLFQSTFFDFLMTCYYQQGSKTQIQEAKKSLRGLRILLVEDNQMNMDISTQYLQRAGMEITCVWNGQEAVDTFTSSAPGTFQAILMDIQMPIMDGYTATETIRASSHQDAKTIPIIAMTANAFNEDIVKALKSGMNDHISKPVFYDRLFEALSKLTQKEI